MFIQVARLQLEETAVIVCFVINVHFKLQTLWLCPIQLPSQTAFFGHHRCVSQLNVCVLAQINRIKGNAVQDLRHSIKKKKLRNLTADFRAPFAVAGRRKIHELNPMSGHLLHLTRLLSCSQISAKLSVICRFRPDSNAWSCRSVWMHDATKGHKLLHEKRVIERDRVRERERLKKQGGFQPKK